MDTTLELFQVVQSRNVVHDMPSEHAEEGTNMLALVKVSAVPTP